LPEQYFSLTTISRNNIFQSYRTGPGQGQGQALGKCFQQLKNCGDDEIKKAVLSSERGAYMQKGHKNQWISCS